MLEMYLLQSHAALHLKRQAWAADCTHGILFISCCVCVNPICANIPASTDADNESNVF